MKVFKDLKVSELVNIDYISTVCNTMQILEINLLINENFIYL